MAPAGQPHLPFWALGGPLHDPHEPGQGHRAEEPGQGCRPADPCLLSAQGAGWALVSRKNFLGSRAYGAA